MVVFNSLTRSDLKKIVGVELAQLFDRLTARGMELELDDEVVDFIIGNGDDLELGARPLRRSIERNLEDPLSEELLRGAFDGVPSVRAVLSDGRVTFVPQLATARRAAQRKQ
ncbi:MAG: hypothetical protein MJ025_00585 [Victivallaceae bacterium]|nr:hypothetical protein [Victivallaceae bacterium]